MFSESKAFARGKRFVRIGEIQRAHGGQECPSYILLRCSESNSQINNIKKMKRPFRKLKQTHTVESQNDSMTYIHNHAHFTSEKYQKSKRFSHSSELHL